MYKKGFSKHISLPIGLKRQSNNFCMRMAVGQVGWQYGL